MTTREQERKHEKTTLIMILFILAGFTSFVGLYVLPPLLAVFSFAVGVGFMLFGVGLAFNFIRVTDKELTDKRGALWIWAVCLLAIVTLAIGWFTLTWPAFMIIDMIESVYTFPAEVTPAIDLLKNVMGWFLILMSLGLLLWAYVNSQRREEVTYPYG